MHTSTCFADTTIPSIADVTVYCNSYCETEYHTSPRCPELVAEATSTADIVTIDDPTELKQTMGHRKRCGICPPSGVIFAVANSQRVHMNRNCQALSKAKQNTTTRRVTPYWGKAAKGKEAFAEPCYYCGQ